VVVPSGNANFMKAAHYYTGTTGTNTSRMYCCRHVDTAADPTISFDLCCGNPFSVSYPLLRSRLPLFFLFFAAVIEWIEILWWYFRCSVQCCMLPVKKPTRNPTVLTAASKPGHSTLRGESLHSPSMTRESLLAPPRGA
jgi:hypothetical protein